MTSHNENHNNPGIFVRIFGPDDFEVMWQDGHGIIEMASNEESATGDPIMGHLEENADSYVREMYSPWGEFEGVAVLRRLTLHESVHYLGRKARLCAFLRPKVQAMRFIQGLEKSKDTTDHKVAAMMRQYLYRFDETLEERMTQSGIYRIMEEQLLNITSG